MITALIISERASTAARRPLASKLRFVFVCHQSACQNRISRDLPISN